MLYALSACDGAELDCSDDLDYPTVTQSQITVTLGAGEQVLLVVDGYNTVSGYFVVNINLACAPDCGTRDCGLDPVCGTLDCGTCTELETCDGSGRCVCAPDCAGAACGADDGCGGSCSGTCPPGEFCVDGVCVCEPDCGVQECGLDLVCNTLDCGTCPYGFRCSAEGECEPL